MNIDVFGYKLYPEYYCLNTDYVPEYWWLRTDYTTVYHCLDTDYTPEYRCLNTDYPCRSVFGYRLTHLNFGVWIHILAIHP